MYPSNVKVETTDKEVAVSRACPMCNTIKTVVYKRNGYDKWASGQKIQDAMPEASANDREHLLTGICSDCWSKL